MFAVLCTRPDLSYALNYFSRYQSNANESMWKSLKTVLRYVKGTIDRKLFYPKAEDTELPLQCYVDADWGGDPDGNVSRCLEDR